MTFSDSLRGYAFPVMQRGGFVCRYCGLDGTAALSNCLHVPWDHLVPIGHPGRDNERFIVAARRFCNEVHNRTMFDVDGKTPEEVVAQKRADIAPRRSEYGTFWSEMVAPK